MDSVLSGHLSLVDKSSGPGRTCLYFNIIISVLSGPLSYVDNGQIFSKFGQILCTKWTKIQSIFRFCFTPFFINIQEQ